jgi:hypothetical protein
MAGAAAASYQSEPARVHPVARHQTVGPDYHAMGQFKAKFRTTLRQVLARYKAARLDVDGYGIRLHNSPPPVAKRLVMMPRSKSDH